MADYRDKKPARVTRASFKIAVAPGLVAPVAVELPTLAWYSGRTVVATYKLPPTSPWVRLFSFRGVAASYTEYPYSVKNIIKTGRVAFVTREPPNLSVYSERRTISSYTRAPEETWLLCFSVRTTLASYTAAPLTVTTAIIKGRVATVLNEPPDILLYSSRRIIASNGLPPKKLGRLVFAGRAAAVVRMPPVAARTYRASFLIQQSDDTTPARAGSIYTEISTKADYLPLQETISPQSVVQAAQSLSIASDDNGQPISHESVLHTFTSWVQGHEATMPWSKMDSPQAFAVYAASGGYISPEFVYSPEDVRTVGQLVAMSSLFEYKPISGLTVPQTNYALATAAVYPDPGTLTFPGDVGRLSLTWVQKVNMGRMPWSNSHVHYVGALYSSKAPDEGMHRSTTTAITIGNIVASAASIPEMYRSTTTAINVGNIVAASSPAQSPTGPVENISQGLYVAVAADYDEVTPSPSHAAAGANVMFASKTRGISMPRCAAQTGQISIEWVKGATYPSPEEMYERNAVALFGQIIGQRSNQETPISLESLPQVGQLIAAHAESVPPDEVYGSGVFIGNMGQVILTTAKYPDVRIPFSMIEADTLGQQLARTAAYPDKAKPQSSVTVSQSVLQVLRSVTYPDLNMPVSFAGVDSAGQQVLLPSGYPDKDTVQSRAVLDTAGQQLARTADYPEKDLAQSKAVIQQLGEQTATVAVYPDKDMPMSRARVTMIRQQILQRNEALSSMPVKLPKHRAQITITFL